MIVTAQRRRRRGGLGQDPFAITEMGPGPTLSISNAPDLSNADLLWNWFPGNFVNGCAYWDMACANRQAMTKQGQAQIQNVADNAVQYYGAGSPVAVATQQAATYQSAQVPADVNTVVNSLTQPGPLSIPWYVWALGAGLLWWVKG